MWRRSFQSVRAFVYAILVCGAIANAQTGDRILTLDSKIRISRDRTLHVDERLEITNDHGFFDTGFHRQLRITPAGPQRAKAGSFQDIWAKVDGSDAAIRTVQNNEVLDIGISLEPAGLSRGKHVIELGYEAKYQFLVYDDFEDFNQDISGGWTIPIDRARVELDFNDGVPNGASITAQTGSGSNFRFDCVRTTLPSGVRFETSHAIPPNEHLSLSARFFPRGYFVSNVKEGGIRAVVENHPKLYPWVVFLAGLLVFTAIGFLLAWLTVNAFGTAWAAASSHRIAITVATVATMLSGASAMVFHQPYTAMPGFMLGAVVSMMISGSPHGGEPFSLVTIALASNFVFYYLVARGLRRVWRGRQIY
jgi:hypothetical protein